jgi:cytochrome c553
MLNLTFHQMWMAFALLIALPFAVHAAEPKTTKSSSKNVGKATSQKTPEPEFVTRKGDPIAGKHKLENERCQECHGADGQGHGHVDGTGKIVKFPKLAGQLPAYLMKQIKDFRSGARQYEFMNMMARSVDDADIADILAYYAAQERMKAEPGNLSNAGKNLYANGDPSRNIVACASCHGADALGLQTPGMVAPMLAGQEWRYLEKQLQDWRSGQRRNDPSGAMNTLLKSLTDADITALADYLSGLK